MSAIALPTVHLNGTSKKELVEQLMTAHTALGEAYSALQAAAPNGRDYYPQGPGAIQLALREHGERLQALQKIRDELVVIFEHVEGIR